MNPSNTTFTPGQVLYRYRWGHSLNEPLLLETATVEQASPRQVTLATGYGPMRFREGDHISYYLSREEAYLYFIAELEAKVETNKKHLKTVEERLQVARTARPKDLKAAP